MSMARERPKGLVPVGGSESLGLVLAAGMILAVTGAFQVLVGIAGLSGDDEVLKTTKYAFQMNLTTWGWIHLVIGIVSIGVGVGLLMGRSWAYVFGLAIAVLSVVSNFAFLPQAPIWSLVVIAFDVIVIRALIFELNNPE
jgi:hypothetical protein